MTCDIRPLSQAVQAYVILPYQEPDQTRLLSASSYDDFNHTRCQKVIFEAGK